MDLPLLDLVQESETIPSILTFLCFVTRTITPLITMCTLVAMHERPNYTIPEHGIHLYGIFTLTNTVVIISIKTRSSIEGDYETRCHSVRRIYLASDLTPTHKATE